MVENIAAKAATVETASLSNLGLVTMQKDLLTKMGSSNESTDTKITDAEMMSKLIESGEDSGSRTQFLSSHLSKMMNKGFDFGNVGKTGSKLKQQAAEMLEDTPQESTADAVSVSRNSSAKARSKTLQMAQLARLAENFEANPQQKAAVSRYVQSYFAYLMSDDPKVKDRMKKDEQMLRQSGIKEDTIFSLQKQIKSAARADISVRIKENLLLKELSDSKLERTLFDLAAKDNIGSAFNNQKLGGWRFGGVFADLTETVDRAASQAQKDISEMLMQDLEEQLVSKMINGDKETSDLNKHIGVLMKMGVNVLSWLEKDWPDKKFDLGLLQTSIFPEDTVGRQVNLNSDGQGGGQRDPQQDQSEAELMMGQLRSLYVQRLISGGLVSNIRMSFRIRKLKNGLMKMGAFSDETEEKIFFEAEAVAKKKIMDMLEEAMIERAGLFKLKGKAFDAHTQKVKQLLKAAERLKMNVDDQDLERIRDNVNARMIKITSDQIEVLESMLARRGSNRKAEKNLGNLKKLKQRLEDELAGARPAEKENDYV